MPQYSGWALQHLSDQMEIVFAVSSGKENHDTRAKAVTETWCAELRNCIYFSDAENPSNEPPTIAISEDGMPAGLDVYVRAQLRFLPMLNYMKNIINQNPKGVFSSVNWIVMCDDDTYVFYHNLYWYLQELDPKQPIYTGDVIPDSWIPVNRDGSGQLLNVSTTTLFVNGGGGSIFSRAALMQMDTAQCVANSLPSGKWWHWQSDWMVGECAKEYGISATRQPGTRFNQFVCTDNDVQFCEGIHYSEFYQPATLHPVRVPSSMRLLWSTYPNSTWETVNNVQIRRVNRNTGEPDMSRLSVAARQSSFILV